MHLRLQSVNFNQFSSLQFALNNSVQYPVHASMLINGKLLFRFQEESDYCLLGENQLSLNSRKNAEDIFEEGQNVNSGKKRCFEHLAF